MNFGRRTFIKGIGAVGIAGAGLTLASGGASATSQVSIDAHDVSAATNDGKVSRVGVSPQFTVDWKGFDDPVGKVFCLVEAKDAEGNWWPLFRATPWLTEELFDGDTLVQSPGESGKLTVDLSPSAFAAVIRDRTDDSDYSIDGPTITVFDGQGRPDYQSWNFDQIGGSIDYDSYIEGNSISGADNYVEGGDVVVGHGPQNNYPGADAGYYGAADSTDHLNEDTDGSNKTTTVHLRYTVVLYGINESEGKYMDYGNFQLDRTRRELTTPEWDGSESTFKQYLDYTQSDDSQKNSALVMNGEDGFPDVTDSTATNGDPANSAASKYYPALQAIAANHPAVTVVETSFDATVTNRAAQTNDVSGTSNTTMT